ncbi:MAG: ATP-binding cassette domain-containing protein [Myxococcales bacterium]|nr:ATP-binding cassette domain-containing protein [Myxococcales bacterium]
MSDALQRSQAALILEEVALSFGPEEVLAGLSAEIPLCGITFVVGRSGCGKSVLCRVALGLLKPSRGRVFLLGQAVHLATERALIALRRKVPYIVQGPALLDWLTVEENVRLAAKAAGAKEAEVRVALGRLGLAELGQRLPPSLGPGTKKRAALARALVLSPRFLVLDEPTTGLDPEAASQVNGAIAAIGREGLGALVVSHDYRALEAMADRVLWLEKGRAAFFGGREEFQRARAVRAAPSAR